MTTPVARHGLDVEAVRDHFPALARRIAGLPIAFLDGPGGTQVPRECIVSTGQEAIDEILTQAGISVPPRPCELVSQYPVDEPVIV
jgi:hypothetical protein